MPIQNIIQEEVKELMAFKSFNQYQEDKNGEFFVLPNDGDFADVIFLYKSTNDVLVADVHYLNTATYKGYVHCCGSSCPACSYGENGIKTQNKIFIPLYNITKGKIEFWDRTTYFEQVLQASVFKNFPDPSICVFRVTRRGAAGSRDTKYEIIPVGKNSGMPYEKILADNKITFPDGYSRICKEMTAAEMSAALNSTASADGLSDYGYTPVPRGGAIEASTSMPTVTTPVYSQPPVSVPPMPENVGIEMPEYNPASVPANPVNSDSTSGSDGDSDLDDVAF